MKVLISGSVKFFPTKEFKTGETITIKQYVGKVDSNFNYPDDYKVEGLRGKPKKVQRFMVEYKDADYQLDMNGASLKLLVAGLGDESDDWIGKQMIGESLRLPTGGKMIEFKPIVFTD